MSQQRIVLVVVILLVFGSAVSIACVMDIPLPVVLGQADLVVVAQVTAAPAPARAAWNLPDSGRPVRGWFRTYTFRVTRVLKTRGVKVGKGDTVKVILRAMPPRRPGVLRIPVGDGMFSPVLSVGGSYILALRALPAKKTYYMPPYFKNCRGESKADVAKYEVAANSDEWPWGKAVKGLQLVVLPQQTSFQKRLGATVRVRRGGRWASRSAGVYVPVVAALRNVSARPIAVSVYPGDRFLSAWATGGKGRTVKADLYRSQERSRLRQFAAKDVLILPPGAVRFVSPHGLGPLGFRMRLDLPLGKSRFQVRFTASRAKGPRGQTTLWTGTVESSPVVLDCYYGRKPQ